MAQKRCYYDVLQVSRSASQEQIAEAYRKLAKQYHPDWNPDDPTTSERFKRITKAYDVLSDPKRRAKYDEKLARRARAANAAPEPPPVQQENTSRTDPPHVEPHAQAEQSPAGDATHQTATQSVSMLRSWIIALKHFLLRLLTFSSKSLGDTQFSFALVVFILAVVAIPASYFVMTYQTPDSEVRSLLARAEVKMQLGDLDEATQLVREATNIEGANNLSAAKKLLDAIAAQQDAATKAEAEQKARQIAERKVKEEAQRRAKIEEEGNLKQVADEATDSERTTKVTYYDNGLKKTEAHYKDGKKDGLSTWWYKNGQKNYEIHYKNGKHVLWTNWYSNGQKNAVTHYKNGKRDGPYTFWWEDGQKRSEGRYKNGKKDGLWTDWYRDGQKTQEVYYDGGQKARMYRWHPNGQKKSEAHFKKGKPDGFFDEWDDLGKKVYERQFKDGELISEKEF